MLVDDLLRSEPDFEGKELKEKPSKYFSSNGAQTDYDILDADGPE